MASTLFLDPSVLIAVLGAAGIAAIGLAAGRQPTPRRVPVRVRRHPR
ncbi:hypothetical protein M0638_05455 [Roseomonas sp. NAR14]|uniref:Uncharacterized protein n=1 Tax=Roseomonas acroporae TaxID=2937791 RepID=A0A9X1Y831_9PROT|nr:hypothetical protein [Roseomonas acroporae]MCK8783827.1 hypothetical protein [Roseomonas acroporae]